MKAIYDATFPLKRIKQRKKICKPWITTELSARIRRKNALYNEFIKTKDPELFQAFKKFRTCLDKDIKMVRRDYYAPSFNLPVASTAALWKKLNSLLNYNTNEEMIQSLNINGIELQQKALADAFNEHFVKIGSHSTPDNDLEGIACNSSFLALYFYVQ